MALISRNRNAQRGSQKLWLQPDFFCRNEFSWLSFAAIYIPEIFQRAAHFPGLQISNRNCFFCAKEGFLRRFIWTSFFLIFLYFFVTSERRGCDDLNGISLLPLLPLFSCVIQLRTGLCWYLWMHSTDTYRRRKNEVVKFIIQATDDVFCLMSFLKLSFFFSSNGNS